MRAHLYAGIVLLLSIVLGVWSYFVLPDIVAIHWNIKGEVDGYGSKWVVILMSPLFMAFLYLLMVTLPKIDPRKESYRKFTGSYHIIINAILTFLFIVQALLIAENLGYHAISIDTIVPLLTGALFLVIGNYTQRVKQNYFIGIRTPWALQDEEVWQKTNRLGAKMLVLAGIIIMLSAFFPAPVNTILFFISIICVAIVPAVASYLFYKKKFSD